MIREKILSWENNWVYLIIIILFSLLGMKAMLHPGLYTAHDISHQVVRFYYYFQALNDGQFPPYWIGQLANRFGYPLFIFSYQLPWMIGSPFLWLGFDISNSLKLLFAFSYLFSGISMYFFIYELTKNRLSGLVASILYLWLPYHFLIIYVGASLGIAFAISFAPIIFLGIHLIGKNSKFGISLFSIGLSGIILSHIMHLVFLFPAIFFFFLWQLIVNPHKLRFLVNIFAGLVLVILISSFYLLPAAYYSQFTRVHQESGFAELYKRNFLNFNQLVYSKWGYGPIINNAKNGESSFQLGFAQWISIILLAGLILSNKFFKKFKLLSIMLIAAFATNIFLILDNSKFIWELLAKIVVVDYPFRFILPAAIVASICSGLVIASFEKRLQILLAVFLIATALFTNRNHINVNQYTNYPISTYLDLETEKTTNTFNEYLPLNASGKLLGQPWNETKGENLLSFNTYQTTNSLLFNTKAENKTIISIGQFYFPGQTLYLDNKSILYQIDAEGRINFELPSGIHTITVKYKPTKIMELPKYLTLAGLFLCFFPVIKQLKKIMKKVCF